MRDYLPRGFQRVGCSSPAEWKYRHTRARHDIFKSPSTSRPRGFTLVKHGPRGVQTRKFLSYNPSGPVVGRNDGAVAALEAAIR